MIKSLNPKLFSIRSMIKISKLIFNDLISTLVNRKIKKEIDNPAFSWLFFNQFGK